jgi:short-subunit dehydrogenase
MCNDNKKYALITGSGDGFGKTLALESARHGMNIILVALPGSGLRNMADYIQRNFGVDVLFFEYDLSQKESCYALHEEISSRNLSVNVLINNAGMGGSHFFDDRDPEYYFRQIELNVVAPVLLSHLFLDILVKNAPSHILNVSSLAGIFNVPKKQVYGGTKSFLLYFSKSLRRELIRKKIYVSAVCPGGMNTTPVLKITHSRMKGLGRWSVMDPEIVAAITIRNMLLKRELIIPGFWNRLFLVMDKLIPKKLKESMMEREMRNMKTVTNPVLPIIQPLKKAV